MNATDKVQAKYREELRKAEREDAISAALEEMGLPQPRMIHVRDLWGVKACLSYGDKHAGGSPSWDDVLTLADNLPGVPMTQVRDSCLSFRPTSYCDSLSEDKKARWDSEISVCPLLARIDGLHGPQLELEWVADLPGVGLVEISCNFRNLPPTVATYNARRVDYRGGYRYERPTVRPAENVQRIECDTPAETVEHTAEVQSPIIWAAGSPEYTSAATLYWIDLRADMVTPTGAIVRAMLPK